MERFSLKGILSKAECPEDITSELKAEGFKEQEIGRGYSDRGAGNLVFINGNGEVTLYTKKAHYKPSTKTVYKKFYNKD